MDSVKEDNPATIDVFQFKKAVRTLASLAEDLWIQTEFYRGYILETSSISTEELESLTEAVSLDPEIRASANKLFSRIFETFDEPGTRAVITDLLSLRRLAGKPN